jgi:hypothetical protein
MRDPKYEVRIYELTTPGNPLTRCGTTYDASSIRFTENFSAAGSYEINIPMGAHYAGEFTKGRIVEIGRKFWGLIQSVQYEAQADGDILSVSGSNLLGLLTQRITIPPNADGSTIEAGFDQATGSSETIIKQFVAHNLVSSISAQRNIPWLTIAPDQSRGLAADKYSTRFELLSDVVGAIAKDAKLGLACSLDVEAGQIIFDVFQGADRTVNQSEVPSVVFSVNRKTVLGMTYNDNDSGLRNAFYATMAGDEFENEALTLVYYRAEDEQSPPGSISRREAHMEISASHPTPGEEYSELKRMALIQATNYESLLNCVCSVNFAAVRYGVDYFLGDMVTVQNLDWGITLDAPLTGMTVEYSGSGESYTATFGEQRPTFIGAIKKAIRTG